MSKTVNTINWKAVEASSGRSRKLTLLFTIVVSRHYHQNNNLSIFHGESTSNTIATANLI